MSAFNAWVCLKGLETLSIRMKAHSDNALTIAKWLSDQSVVEKVYYTGLPEHEGFELACKQQKGFSGMLSFSVTGGKEQAWQVIDATQMLSITANLGDAKTTIVHPATTTHGRLSDEQRMEAGIGDNLIRLSVGLEGVQDIINDLDRGLARIR
jgi:O-succinylhomoserine sulfhydrylase